MERRSFLGALTAFGAALGLAKEAVGEDFEEFGDNIFVSGDLIDARYTDEDGRVFQHVTRTRFDDEQHSGRLAFWKHDEGRTGVVTFRREGLPTEFAGVAHSPIPPGHHGFIQVGGPAMVGYDVIRFKGAPIHEDLYIPRK